MAWGLGPPGSKPLPVPMWTKTHPYIWDPELIHLNSNYSYEIDVVHNYWQSTSIVDAEGHMLYITVTS